MFHEVLLQFYRNFIAIDWNKVTFRSKCLNKKLSLRGQTTYTSRRPLEQSHTQCTPSALAWLLVLPHVWHTNSKFVSRLSELTGVSNWRLCISDSVSDTEDAGRVLLGHQLPTEPPLRTRPLTVLWKKTCLVQANNLYRLYISYYIFVIT